MLGCTIEPPTLSESIDIVEAVRKNPNLAQSKCPTILDDDIQNQCWSVTPLPLEKEDQKKRCSHLTGSSKDECYFKMAERHNDFELCKDTGPFSVDCTTHILQQNCGRYQTASSLLTYAKELGLNTEQSAIAGLLHRCLLGHQPNIDIRKCSTLPHSDKCRTLAINLFSQKLTSSSIDCTDPISRLNTFNDPDFEKLTTEHIAHYCASQD